MILTSVSNIKSICICAFLAISVVSILSFGSNTNDNLISTHAQEIASNVTTEPF